MDQSSKTIICHSLLDQIRPAISEKVILGDREFCSETNFEYFQRSGLKFAVRLKVGNRKHPVRITRKNKSRINYSLKKVQMKIWNNVYYKGKIKVNLIGFWDKKYRQPIYIITNTEAKRAFKLYKLRMKIEESFKDEKSKLGIAKIMTRSRKNFIKLILFALLAYGIALLIGEELRKVVLSKKSKKKFSELHLLFYMINSYSRQQLLSATKKALAFLRSINDYGSGILSIFRRGYV